MLKYCPFGGFENYSAMQPLVFTISANCGTTLIHILYM